MVLGIVVVGNAQITLPYGPWTTSVPVTQLNNNITTLASNALNRNGGTVAGNIAVNSGTTIDGIDISAALGDRGTHHLHQSPSVGRGPVRLMWPGNQCRIEQRGDHRNRRKNPRNLINILFITQWIKPHRDPIIHRDYYNMGIPIIQCRGLHHKRCRWFHCGQRRCDLVQVSGDREDNEDECGVVCHNSHSGDRHS